MTEHVAVRCGEFRLLLPSFNIRTIVTGDEGRSWSRALHAVRRRKMPVFLDLRRYLGATDSASGPYLEWISTDGGTKIGLIVDTVDQIVICRTEDIRPVPFLPKRLRSCCRGVLAHESERFHLIVNLDARLPMTSFRERRDYLSALKVMTQEHAA